MKKKLKLRIAKFDRALVVEQLKLEGDFLNTQHIWFRADDVIFQCWVEFVDDFDEKARKNFGKIFNTNEERDVYIKKVVSLITEEVFVGVEPIIEGEIYTWETK